MTAFTGVAGLLLGFYGVPTFVTPPTARTVTATVTETATATVTATATPVPGPSGSGGSTPNPNTGDGKNVPLTDITPINESYGGWESKPVIMGGRSFDNALTTEPGYYDSFGCSINEHYKSLTVTVGLHDDSAAYPATVTFASGEDGEKTLKSVAARINRPVEVTVDLTGVAILTIAARQGDGNSVNVALGDPVLHRL
ncbi:NPCBM/NEW2 domain-containing protein [Streptomyces aurantiacus]|uniref:NPCBM/NEW2 domain-containing protein n=1 Tax=Streptomyces aurantiacus TaxID=47760 RepID=UPI0006E42A77|nr:NPCBM/NEW2 domain-containing protein [Streptomyces aurantiacus]